MVVSRVKTDSVQKHCSHWALKYRTGPIPIQLAQVGIYSKVGGQWMNDLLGCWLKVGRLALLLEGGKQEKPDWI